MRAIVVLVSVAFTNAAGSSTLQCLQKDCGAFMTACKLVPGCNKAITCMEGCKNTDCENQCFETAGQGASTLAAADLGTLGLCGSSYGCFKYGMEAPAAVTVPATTASDGPCCDKPCELPLVKYFSTDALHGFCGEACMDPTKFNTYHKIEANLTRASGEHPCKEQWTPNNKVQYTDYFQTVTHGVPGLLSVTLDLYAPTGMPDHSCCDTPLFTSLNCVGIPGKPQSMTIMGTGPYCCPKSATEATPCSADVVV